VDTILILDFGSQTTQLIARRIRERGVYSRILPGDTPASEMGLEQSVKGIILSGSPYSVNDADAPVLDPAFYDAVDELGIPVLGICYGLQRMVSDLGGGVAGDSKREFGRSRQFRYREHPLFTGVPDGFISWMSHGDRITELPEQAELVSESEHGMPGTVDFPRRNMVGIQFHPEVSHCEYGPEILGNFAGEICRARAEWSMAGYARHEAAEIRERVGDTPVVLLISGGVDSTVAAALLLQALPPEHVYLLYVDNGLMRKDETEQVTGALERLGAVNLHVVDASDRFLAQLRGVEDPEEKRRAIGDEFMRVQQDELRQYLPDSYYLAQGTLYPDLVESGSGVGNKARVIKSHHNVRSPLVQEKRKEGRIIEPLRHLYKDEVRRLGTELGVPEETVKRHPFPGPGLAVRIVGEVTRERCEVLREVDAIYIAQLKERGLYDEIWQAFCVLLPIRSVGVTGDERGYGHVVALRAVVSRDGMTADVYPFPHEDLAEISARITNEIPEVGRVVYDVSSKPPATIEWE
jgi:GMP synthase (glutamine-hydrolysing)